MKKKKKIAKADLWPKMSARCSTHPVACYLFCRFTIFRSDGFPGVNVCEPGWILCNSGGIAFTAAQIYLKFGTEPALSAGKPHCGWATQAAGMTALHRRHVLRSQSINKRVTGNVFGTQKYWMFNKMKAFCYRSLSLSFSRARFFLLQADYCVVIILIPLLFRITGKYFSRDQTTSCQQRVFVNNFAYLEPCTFFRAPFVFVH